MIFFRKGGVNMKISQILNNNVALVNRGENEVIVVSPGIAFKKKKGQTITEAEIEKTYILDSYDMLEHFSYLLSNSNPNDIILIHEIISYGEKQLDIKASDYLSLTLLDHLEYLIKRAEKQQFIKSPLYFDIKRFYPKHFKVGLTALKLIEKSTGLQLPDDEAVSITLHFVNMQPDVNATQEQTLMEMHALKDILSIIQMHFKVRLDENTTQYMRFVTHLQYFVQRLIKSEAQKDDVAALELYKQIRNMYPEADRCVQKIKIYVKSQFESTITASEETYLMLHINRVMQAGGNE